MTGSVCQEHGPHMHESFSDADGMSSRAHMIISPHLSWPTTRHAHMVTQSHADAPPVIDHTQALLGMSGNHGVLQVDKAKWDV